MIRQTQPAPQIKGAYTTGPSFVVRIVGLSLDILRSLDFNRTMHLIEELFELEQRLQSEAEALSDELYRAIGAVEDKQLRMQLVALRRTIFHLQRPKNLNEHIWSVLPEALVQRVQTWLIQLDSWLLLLSQGESTLETEWNEKRQELRRIAMNQTFQQGLALASKDLYADMQRWLQTEPGHAQRRDRQLELGLFTYLSRMATKTSPFSVFTSSGRGYWTSSGSVLEYTSHWQRKSIVELNWSIAHRIAYEVSRFPQIRSTLTFHVNPSLQEDAAELRFLGWKNGESVIKLAASPTLQRILRIVRETAEPSYAAIVQAITQADDGGREEEVKLFLDKLIKIGLLELNFGIPDQSFDYLGQLLIYLQRFPQPEIASLSLRLRAIQSYLSQYVKANAEERYVLRDTIYASLKEMYQYLELNQRGLEVPGRNAFYENTLVEGIAARCALDAWQKPIEDLSLVQKLSALYDKFLPGRLAVTAFFVDHYGEDASIDLLRFYEDLYREKQQPGGWRAGYRVSGSHLLYLYDNPFAAPPVHLPVLDQLLQMRRKFYLQHIKPSLNGESLCQLDARALGEFVNEFPSFISIPHSLNIYCQMWLDNGEPHLVLNTLRSGFGQSESRLRLMETQLDKSSAPSHNKRIPPATGPLWVDILGVFGSNVSLHVAQTPHEITYPGAVSARPEQERIPLNDLYVVYNAQHHRLQLWSRTLQREILPVHHSLLADFWQPPLYRFIIRTFSEGATNPLLVLLQMANSATFGAVMPLCSYPRICLGNLVLGRASWVVGTDHLPKREKGFSSFDYMLKLQRWLKVNHLPQQCFVRNPIDLLPLDESDSYKPILTKYRKPLHIDFSNYFNVMLFEQIVAHVERMELPAERVLLLQEVLPGKEDLLFSDGTQKYVSEFIIELTQTGADQ